MLLFNHRDTKLFLDMIVSWPQSSHNTMPKKGKKKSKATVEDSNLEIFPRMEIIYEYTKAVTGPEPEFKWGQIYPMIKYQKVPDAGLEYIPLYANTMRSRITKVATRSELFPCAEVIEWILPRIEVSTMIISNTEGQAFAY